MRQFSLLSMLTGALLVFGMTFGALLCVITAFHVACAPAVLALVCVASALLFCLIFSFRRAWIGLLVTAPAAGYALWRLWAPVTGGLALTANTIAPEFINAFSLEQSYILLPQLEQAGDALYFFAALAFALSLLLSWAVMRAQSPSVCAVTTLPYLVLCLIILDTPPAGTAVALLCGSLLLLVLTQQVREHDSRQGAKLTAWMLLPLAGLLALVMLLSPPEDYQRAAWPDALRARINETVDKLSFLRENEQTGQMEFVSPFTPSTLGAFSWDSSVKSVDLSRLGPMRKTGRSVMRVYAPNGGTVYLRASSMAVYADNRWRALDAEDYDALALTPEDYLSPSDGLDTTIQIETNMKSSVLYVPYYAVQLPENTELYGDAYIKNTLQATQYAITCNPYSNSNTILSGAQFHGGYGASESYAQFVREHYLDVPEQTATAIETYFQEHPHAFSVSLDMLPASVLAGYAASLVQQGKTYSLDTPKSPSGEDFVSWFLLESDTGYCVHFATAATMVLRQLGVPARYVTGYMVSAEVGSWTQVTEDSAHAWVEYYDEQYGWQQLEVTPPDGGEGSTEPVESQPDDTQTTEILENSGESPADASGISTELPSSQKPDVPAQTEPDAQPEQTSSVPAPEASGGERGGKKSLSPWTAVWCALALAALWLGYRVFAIGARHAQFTTGVSNKRAVMLYRHIRRLSKLTGSEIPEELTELAQRAKFSQHRLSEDDVAQLNTYSETLMQTLTQTRSLWKRFVYRMIYALW